MLAKLCGFPFPFLEYSKWVEMDVLWMRCSVLCRMHKRDFEVGREWLWQLGLWRSPRLGFQTPMMMMIAFITIKSSLVPSIWVLYAQIYSGFETSVVWRSHLWLFFSEEKYVQEKSCYCKISSHFLAYTYTCVLCTHIWNSWHVCQDLVHLHSSGPPGVSSRPLGSQPSTPCVQCVCVCAYTHTYTHIHSQPR